MMATPFSVRANTVLEVRCFLLYCSKNKIKYFKGKGVTQQGHITYSSHTSWSTRPFEETITNKKQTLKWLLTLRPPAMWKSSFHSLLERRETQALTSLCSGVEKPETMLCWCQYGRNINTASNLFWVPKPNHQLPSSKTAAAAIVKLTVRLQFLRLLFFFYTFLKLVFHNHRKWALIFS